MMPERRDNFRRVSEWASGDGIQRTRGALAPADRHLITAWGRHFRWASYLGAHHDKRKLLPPQVLGGASDTLPTTPVFFSNYKTAHSELFLHYHTTHGLQK